MLFAGICLVLVASWYYQQATAQAQVAEDCGRFTSFVADCLPEASKPKIKELINGAVELGVDEGLREIDRERRRQSDRRSYEAPKMKVAPMERPVEKEAPKYEYRK